MRGNRISTVEVDAEKRHRRNQRNAKKHGRRHSYLSAQAMVEVQRNVRAIQNMMRRAWRNVPAYNLRHPNSPIKARDIFCLYCVDFGYMTFHRRTFHRRTLHLRQFIADKSSPDISSPGQKCLYLCEYWSDQKINDTNGLAMLENHFITPIYFLIKWVLIDILSKYS